jgi:hypothetical protein
MQEKGAGERRRHSRKAVGAGPWPAVRAQELRTGDGCARVGLERPDELLDRAGTELRVLVQEQAVASARSAQQSRVVLRFARAPFERDQADRSAERLDRPRRAVVGGVVEHEDLGFDPGSPGALDRLEASEQQFAPAGIDDAIREQHGSECWHPCASR